MAAAVTKGALEGHVIVYSGPLPPSGGVRRPPLADMAPHWTQFEGATDFDGVASSSSGPSSYTSAGHIRAHSSATFSLHFASMRMWFG